MSTADSLINFNSAERDDFQVKHLNKQTHWLLWQVNPIEAADNESRCRAAKITVATATATVIGGKARATSQEFAARKGIESDTRLSAAGRRLTTATNNKMSTAIML